MTLFQDNVGEPIPSTKVKCNEPAKTVLPIAWQVAQRCRGHINVLLSTGSLAGSSFSTHFT